MTSEQLAKINPAVEQFITNKKLGGASVLVLRRGKIVFQNHYGFSYSWSPHPVDAFYKKAQALDRKKTLAEMTQAISSAPLLYQPGTQWVYGINTDVLVIVTMEQTLPYNGNLENTLKPIIYGAVKK
ncbi:MAG: hypothetical protein ACJAVK_003285 [Akkermansiaceae bacterium]|jgi:hypothetical protein